MPAKNILFVPDMHHPYSNPRGLNFLCRVRDKFKIDTVFCLGDELDQYSASQYAKSPEALNGDREYDLAMRSMRKFYNEFPEGKSVTSNHVERVAKRASEVGIPKGYLRGIADFMQAPKGWKWQDHWVVDGVRVEHGERAGGETGLRRLVAANMMSTVVGHNHSGAGTTFISNGEVLLWGLNAGCLVDLDSVAFRYGNNQRMKSVNGCGVVSNGVPMFIPLN